MCPGSDIMEGNQTLTLALVWQLMRAYTLSLLSKLNEDGTPIVESEIISWANNKVCEESIFLLSNASFPVDRGREDVTDQALPGQDQQDGPANNRPDRCHEDRRH